MKRRSKLSIQVYRAITVTAIGLMIGAAPMRVMTVQAQETQKNQKQQSDYQKLDYKVFEDSSERLLEWSDIYMLSNEDIRIAKNEIYARHGRRFASTDLQSYFDQMAWYNGTVQPQNFDSGCLNAVEVANISFWTVSSWQGLDQRTSLFRKRDKSAKTKRERNVHSKDQ